MADVGVARTQQKGTDQQNQGAVSRQDTGLRRRSEWSPWSSSDFLSANPFSLMRRMSEDMDRMFGRFFAGEGDAGWAPAIEVSETDGQLKIAAELPGMKPEDVRVEVNNDQLIIQGERKFEQEQRDKGVYRSERRYGQFYRAIPLPEGTNPDQAKAQFNNGVLEVTVPVPQRQQSRQVPIQS